MERRVLLAIFLSFLVLYVYQALVVKPLTPAPKTATAGSAAPQAPTTTPAANPPSSAAAPDAAAVQTLPAESTEARSPTGATAVVSDTTERDIRIETRDVIAVFTNRGARLKSWRLKHYFDPHRQPQELVDTTLPSHPLPFTLRTADEPANRTINNALYAVSGEPSGPVTAPTDLRFEYRDSAGIDVVKTFHFEPTSYIVAFQADVNLGDRVVAPTIEWGPAVGDVAEVSRYVQAPEGLLFQSEKPQRIATKDLAKQSTFEGDFKYAGVDDNYFMTVAMFTGPSKISFQSISIPPPPNTKDAPRVLVAYSVDRQTRGTPLKFFVGPKDFDVLASIDRDFARAINFGMFAVIVAPLLRSLKWVNGFVGNYGWSIVILTLIINAIMFPLRHKSAVSMRKMQEIQPQVKAIQERYAKYKATDPAKQKMNQELMELYRERGVNPASGCVPMLLTIPVMLAMWALLQTSIELRGAPWIGWIHDLTSHDPYFVLAIAMGVTSFWQQRLMPSAGADPAQQKMMMFMPVMMTGMLAWLPAGALLYYVVTNIWGIGQQYLTNYLIGPPNIRTVRPPAERRVKKVGNGKTEAAAREK
jgi:YidC/Oxa1 family membrane protein insertase